MKKPTAIDLIERMKLDLMSMALNDNDLSAEEQVALARHFENMFKDIDYSKPTRDIIRGIYTGMGLSQEDTDKRLDALAKKDPAVEELLAK